MRQVVTAGLASAEDAELLGVIRGDALLLVRRFAIDPPRAAVLALSDHRYLAQRFALEVEFQSRAPRRRAAGQRHAEPTGIPRPSLSADTRPTSSTKEHIA